MGPQSPATQMLQHVQHLQITDLDSDVDLGEPPSEQALGVPRSWLDDDYDSDSASTSYRDDTQSSCIQHSSLQPNVLDLASQVRQQQQGHLIKEDAQYQEELAQRREHTLQALRQQHQAKAQHNQQVQETIKSQEQALQQQQRREKQQRDELEAQRQQQEAANKIVEEHQRQQQLQESHKQQQERQQRQEQAQSQAAQSQQHQQPQFQQQQQARLSSGSTQPEAPGQPAASAVQASALNPGSLLRCADSAAQEEAKYKAALEEAEAETSSYTSDGSDAGKMERRGIEKQLLKLVQQVSGTQEQVRNKSTAILRVFSQLSGHRLTYAYLQLARKLLLQCENQITLNPRSGFPFAEVAAAVAAQHPRFAVLLVAKLHEVCPLSVPKCYLNTKGSPSQYCKLMRYVAVPDPKTGQDSLEKHEAYLRRNSGFVIFYAAVMQSERHGNPLALDTAWKYIARLLNALPANRAVGTALFAFLQTAGYRLWQVYRSQFVKLLKFIFDHFHPNLIQSNEPDIKAIAARLGQYINQHAYRQVPEGQQLPTHDESTDLCLNH